MINNVIALAKKTDELYEYLRQHNFHFNEHGFPVFKREMFLDEWPEMVITYEKRNDKLVPDPKKTLLCFYCPDKDLYPRLDKVLDEIDEYKRFMGSVFMDITVTNDLPPDTQRLIMLANHLHGAVLAANGIKIVANLRTGDEESRKYLSGIPVNAMCSCGFLGCDVLKEEYDFSFLRKIMQVLPRKLVIYGKEDPIATKQLHGNGINYRYYPDFHTYSKSLRD